MINKFEQHEDLVYPYRCFGRESFVARTSRPKRKLCLPNIHGVQISLLIIPIHLHAHTKSLASWLCLASKVSANKVSRTLPCAPVMSKTAKGITACVVAVLNSPWIFLQNNKRSFLLESASSSRLQKTDQKPGLRAAFSGAPYRQGCWSTNARSS